MAFALIILAFCAGWFFKGFRRKQYGEYDLYKKTNGLYEPVKRE